MSPILKIFQRYLLLVSAAGVVFLVLIPLLALLLKLDTDISHLSAIWQKRQLRPLIINTLLLAGAVSICASLIGSWLAWVQQRARYPGHHWLGLMSLLPLAMPSFLLAVVIREAFAPVGLLGQLWGGQLFRGFIPAVIVLTIITTPYIQLLVSAALSKLSAAEEEAAQTLGASRWQLFKQIIWPHIRPAFAFAWLLTWLYVISDFGAVAILDMPVLTWHLYQAIAAQNLSQATVIGAILLLITLPLLIIGRYIHGRMQLTTTLSNTRPVKRLPLGIYGKITTYCCHAFIIGIGIILPVLSLSQWVYWGWYYDNSFAPLKQPIIDTLKVTIGSSFGIVLLALLPAWVVARLRPRGAGLLEQGIYLTNSLPGILLAFGLLLAALLVSRAVIEYISLYHFLLNSGILLFLGYMMRFMAKAYSGVKSALLAYDLRWYESAQILNVPRWRYILRIWLPGMAPGLSAALLLVFIALLKELPVTLLLGGAMGIRTLSFRIFDRYQEAFLHDVGSAGLVLLSMSLVFVIISLRWRQHV